MKIEISLDPRHSSFYCYEVEKEALECAFRTVSHIKARRSLFLSEHCVILDAMCQFCELFEDHPYVGPYCQGFYMKDFIELTGYKKERIQNSLEKLINLKLVYFRGKIKAYYLNQGELNKLDDFLSKIGTNTPMARKIAEAQDYCIDYKNVYKAIEKEKQV